MRVLEVLVVDVSLCVLFATCVLVAAVCPWLLPTPWIFQAMKHGLNRSIFV